MAQPEDQSVVPKAPLKVTVLSKNELLKLAAKKVAPFNTGEPVEGITSGVVALNGSANIAPVAAA